MCEDGSIMAIMLDHRSTTALDRDYNSQVLKHREFWILESELSHLWFEWMGRSHLPLCTKSGVEKCLTHLRSIASLLCHFQGTIIGILLRIAILPGGGPTLFGGPGAVYDIPVVYTTSIPKIYWKNCLQEDRSGVYMQCHAVYTAATAYAVYLQYRLPIHCRLQCTFLVQPFLVELIGVEFSDETYQSQHI